MTPRECRYGHGALGPLRGTFSLAGLLPLSKEMAGSGKGRTRTPDGRVLGVKVFLCPVCGYIELIDEDKSPV